MADYSHILFNKTPDQLKRLGARGGKAYGRNQRARRALAPLQPESIARPAVPQETTPAAIAILDAQFPWLRGVENRVPGSNRRPYGEAVGDEDQPTGCERAAER